MDKNRGIRRLIKAFGYSLAGFRAAWKNEDAFRQEILATIIILPAGLWLGETGTQRAVLIGTWLIVIITEFLNSAVEAVVDRMGSERHELSGMAKDFGSAAVLVGIFSSFIVWGLIAYDRFF